MKIIFWMAYFCLFFVPALGFALSPIIQYQDLVAGRNLEPGFEDGPFYSAQFNYPLGLVLNSANSVLYVADMGNNRIRAIQLDLKNSVETIAGTGEAGQKDGPLTIASFNRPVGLALLPNNQIAVNDRGNGLIRLIDLDKGMVSTLKVKNAAGTLGKPWNLVYLPSDQSLYFSDPDAGTLLKLKMESGEIETVLKNNALVPHPKALCIFAGNLYVADRDLPDVYKIELLKENNAAPPKPKSAPGSTPSPTEVPTQPVSLQSVGTAHAVMALAGSEDCLYAYQADPQAPIYRLFPHPQPLSFVSVWGDIMLNPGPGVLPHFCAENLTDPIGFIPDPTSGRRFYISNPSRSFIATFRDLQQAERLHQDGDNFNSGGVVDFEYPHPKPPKTFRILLVGRSYPYWSTQDHFFATGQPIDAGLKINLMATLPKYMELTLNTRAALEDIPLHYEVFNGSTHYGNRQEEIWPYYLVPKIVKNYDIDLVVIMKDPNIDWTGFFESPMTSEGIPQAETNDEYLLKPNAEKFKSGPDHDFFQLCLSKKFMNIQSDTCWAFPDVNGMMADPQVRAGMISVLGKPLKMLHQKLSAYKTRDGKPCQMYVCYYVTPLENGISYSKFRDFWEELCSKNEVPFFDIFDEFSALNLTYSPDFVGHFTEKGMFFFNTLLVYKMTKLGLIPGTPSQPVSLK